MTTHADTVRQSYDSMAASYLEWVESKPSPRIAYLDKLLSLMPAKSRVLELGCGAGIPATLALAQNSRVDSIVANDISEAQIALARDRLRDHQHVELIAGDMTTLAFEGSSFDGVAAFFSILHIPRADQPALLANIYRWMKPGGVIVANFGASAGAEVKGKFFGEEMFWSSWGPDGTKQMFADAGFEVVEATVMAEEGLAETDPDYATEFVWVVAKKSAAGTS